MATRHLAIEDLVRTPPTRIRIRPVVHEPREERTHFPKSLHRPRPLPISIPSVHQDIVLNQYSPFRTDSLDDCEVPPPPPPQIVDVVPPSKWKRKGARSPLREINHAVSPSEYSQCSTRQSELSFGILDYYTDERTSPRHSRDAILMSPVDVAIKQFDFDLQPLQTSLPVQGVERAGDPDRRSYIDTQSGAEDETRIEKRSSVIQRPPTPFKIRLNSIVSTPTSTQGKPTTKYSLFPTIKSPTTKQINPPPMPPSPAITAVLCSPHTPQTQTRLLHQIAPPLSTPDHRHPDTSYRPRRESISGGSMHSRKDSITSIRSSRRMIPLRILSSSTVSSSGGKSQATITAGSKTRDSQKSTSSTASPPSSTGGTVAGLNLNLIRSRWSDETMGIASPTAPLSGYVRPSFGSVFPGSIDRESDGSSGQFYPTCFFEDDDDEAVPLHRRLGSWGRWSGERNQRRKGRAGRFDARPASFGRKVVRVLLCGGCV